MQVHLQVLELVLFHFIHTGSGHMLTAQLKFSGVRRQRRRDKTTLPSMQLKTLDLCLIHCAAMFFNQECFHMTEELLEEEMTR